MIAQGRSVDLGEIEIEAAGLWREFVEEYAQGIGDGQMPTVEVPADVVCSLIRRYVAPMTPQVREAGKRMIKHIEALKKLAADMRLKAVEVAGGQHMVSVFPAAKELMHKAAMAEMQADDFLAILGAIPEPPREDS